MQIKGINGSATDKDHQGWIPLLDKSFQVSVSAKPSAGYNSSRQMGAWTSLASPKHRMKAAQNYYSR